MARTAAACAIVLDERGRVLLQCRSDDGRWVLPGGAIETGESAAEAVEREVLEETGCRVEAVRLVGVYSQPAHTTIRYPDGKTVQYVALAFECRLLQAGEPGPAAASETARIGWFDPADLPAGFGQEHRERLRDALERREAAFVR